MSSYSPNPTAAAQPAVTVRRSRRRIGILALLAIGTMINYLDRTVLGIAAPKLTAELGIDPAIMGILFSAFAWTYALAQIPGGLFLDRFGNKVTYFLSLTLWSLFTLFHGMAVGLKTLLLCRFGLGISEAPCFPVNSRVVSAWFPQQERAKATAVYTVGEYLGLACFAPLLFWIMDGFGWRVLFVSVGAVGILFALVWWRCYREPHEDPRLSQQEREHIENGGGLSAPTDQQVAFSWPLVRQLLSKRQIIGASIGQFAGNTVLVFFLTWFPIYLVQEKGMSILKVGLVASIPALCGFAGGVLGGVFSDYLIKRGFSITLARKLPIVLGMLLASTIILCNYTDNTALVVTLMALAFFGKGFGALGWPVISDTAPKEIVGLCGGVFNVFGNVASIVTPLVIGYLVSELHSFNAALVFVGCSALMAMVCYLFVVGDIKRMELQK